MGHPKEIRIHGKRLRMTFNRMPIVLRVAIILTLLVLTAIACQSASDGQTTPHADRRIAFPVHQEPLGTDLGLDYLAGELRAEDGCLKLYRLGWDDPKRTVSEQLRDMWLPVWPSGFALRQDGDETQVIDGNGATVARAGDIVRFGGRSYWSDETGQEELEKTVPKACRGLYYLVGDEVSVVASDEARVVRLPGTTLWFPRSRTGGGGPPFASNLAEPPKGQPLTLDGDCLRIGKDGPVVIWPTGFYPDVLDGRVVVRNGGGRVVAVVGQEMKLGSGGYISGNSGLCAGPLWGGTRFLEFPDRETLGPVPTKVSVPTITPARTPSTPLSTLTERPEPMPEQTGVIPSENEHSVPIITTSASLIQDWTLPPQSVQDFVNRSQAIVIGTVTAISEPVIERPYNFNPADFAELPESQWPSIEVAYWTIEIEQMLLDDGNIEANPKVRMEPNPPHRTDKPLPQLNGRYLFTLGRNTDSQSYGISADWMILNLGGDEIKDIGGTAPGFADGVREAALVEDIKEAARNHEYLPPGQWPDRSN